MLKVFWLLFILLHTFLFQVTTIQAGFSSSTVGNLVVMAIAFVITGGGLQSIRALTLNRAAILLVGATMVFLLATGFALAAFGTSRYETVLPAVFACGLFLSGCGLAFKFKTDAQFGE